MPSRILSCAWTTDGQYLALGMFNGIVSIRSRLGDELVKIERDAPIWTLQWNPAPGDSETLVVGDWSQQLAFYQLNGKPISKDKSLGFDPCCISMAHHGEFMIVGGSGRKLFLYSRDGCKIYSVAERETWIWCCQIRPKTNMVAFGTHDGQVCFYQITFNTVHGLFHDRYVYRENLTDVVIQHLSTDQRARIKCRDHVRKLSIYRNRIAMQLSDCVLVYERIEDPANNLFYKIKERISKKLECNLLVVTASNIVLCIEKKLQLLSLTGEREREWHLDALIRYIKVIGGPPGKEGMLVGLKSGVVLLVYINNPFPVSIVKLNAAVRCLDLSQNRRKVAIVDEHSVLHVYDIKTRSLLFTENNANSVAWNTENEDMICFSGNGILSIKAGMSPPHQQKMTGFVVGFKGSKIFSLNASAMVTIDVPQSASMDQHLEAKDLRKAYQIACLGVTDADWRRLAINAMESLDLDVATKAFARLRDLKFLELLKSMEQRKLEGQNIPELFLAETYAYQGRFHEVRNDSEFVYTIIIIIIIIVIHSNGYEAIISKMFRLQACSSKPGLLSVQWKCTPI